MSLEWIERPTPSDTKPQPSPAGALVLVGPAEIAERLGKKRATVSQWRWRGLLPEPLAYLDDGTKGNQVRGRQPSPGLAVWDWEDIREWAIATDRL